MRRQLPRRNGADELPLHDLSRRHQTEQVLDPAPQRSGETQRHGRGREVLIAIDGIDGLPRDAGHCRQLGLRQPPGGAARLQAVVDVADRLGPVALTHWIDSGLTLLSAYITYCQVSLTASARMPWHLPTRIGRAGAGARHDLGLRATVRHARHPEG